MVSNADSAPVNGVSDQFRDQLTCLFDILADGEATVPTPSLIRLWQLSDYAVSFALIDAFQKYSGYDNQLGFEQFNEAVRHCLSSCEPYIAAAAADASAQAAVDAAIAVAASESGYRTFDSSRSLEPQELQPPPPPVPKHAPHRPPLRVHSDSGVLDRDFDGRPRPLRPPDYETYMNNSLDWGSGGCGGGSGRRSRLKPPVPPRTSAVRTACGGSYCSGSDRASEQQNSPPTPSLLTAMTTADADADDYETLIGHPMSRGPPEPPPRPPINQQLSAPAVSGSKKDRQRARSPMKRLMQAFTKPLTRSQSFRLSRPQPQQQQQQRQPSPPESSAVVHPAPVSAKFASFVENPDRFSGSYHARGALLRERLRCVRQAYECVEACRQSLVAQIADLQSQLAGCPVEPAPPCLNGDAVSSASTTVSPASATAAAGRLLADQEARIQRLEREKSQLLRTLLQAQALG